MIRVLSYNIWVGGAERVNALTKMMRSKHPDLIGLIEATNSQVVIELAEKLGMHYYCMSGNPGEDEENWQVAVLSRLPFVGTPIAYIPSSSSPTTPLIGVPVIHARSSLMTKPLLEVCVEEPDGTQLSVFVAHLIATFGDRTAGDNIRKQEVEELLRIMAPKQGTPHLLMGDFSAIARGDWLKGSILLRYVVNLQKEYKRNPEAFLEYPTLDYVVPQPFLLFTPFLSIVPSNKLLCILFDLATTILRAPKGNLHLLFKADYIDCFRSKNPRLEGFTAPAIAPSARFDFIFASQELAPRLSACSVVERAEDITAADASDHLPIFAEFL